MRSPGEGARRVIPLDFIARAVLALAPRAPGIGTRVVRYASAVLAALAVGGVQSLAFREPSIAPFVLFYFAIALSAGLAGQGPGLLCVALSAEIANRFFMGSYSGSTAARPALIATGLFVVSGSLVALFCASFRRSLLRMEITAREHENRGTLLRLAHDAVVVWRLGGAIEFWNEGAEQLYGYSVRDAVGRLSHDLLHTQFPQPWGEIEATLRERRRWQGELRHRARDGRTVIVSSNLQLVQDADGGDRVLEANRDITERKRAEQRFRAINDLGLIGVLYWTSDGTILDANDKFLEMVGYTRDDLRAGRIDWAGMTPPEWRAVGDRAFEDLRTRGRSPPIEKEYIRKDGSRIPVFIGGAMLDEFRTEGVAFIVDITEHKRAEEKVQTSRQGLSRLAEASLRVMAETDLRGMLQAIAEAAVALTGARVATCVHGVAGGQLVIGASSLVPGSPAGPPGSMLSLEKGHGPMAFLDGRETIRLTEAELRADPRWWALPPEQLPMRGLLGVRMLARSGAPSGAILVTDREAGDFTADDESLLKQLATVASLALQHIEARVSLEEADRRKSEFLGMLSHELRNPLAAIRNGLYVLARAQPGSDQAARAKAVVERQTDQLTRLTDDLLDLTRISRGKIRLQPETLDLAALLRSTVEDHRQQFNNVAVELELVIGEESPLPVSVDPTRMKQVIGNLLNNAAKFTPRGGRTTISLRRGDGDHAVLTVRDTGVGIGPEVLSRLFEPFVQSETTLDRSTGGLGLGLALVKGLVEQHRGDVAVHSDGVGRGATFVVRLPLERRQTPRLTLMPQAEGRFARRILLVEDNQDSANTLREAFEMNGHVVEVAFTGFDGIDKARAFRPDVILCDIGLPGMDGYEVARRIRADPLLRGIPLFALSGYAQPEDVERSREAGFDLHLAKPVDLDELEVRLSQARGASTAAS